MPATNTEYWSSKIARNRHRDARNAKLLRAANWRVHTIWECTAKASAERLVRSLERRRKAYAPPPLLTTHGGSSRN